MRYAVPIGRTSSGAIVCQVLRSNPIPKAYGMKAYRQVQQTIGRRVREGKPLKVTPKKEYVHERYASPRIFTPASFRVVEPRAGTLVTIGCLRGWRLEPGVGCVRKIDGVERVAPTVTQKLMKRRAGSNPSKKSTVRAAGLGELKQIAGQEFRRIARVGVPGISRRIERGLKREHRESLQDPRELVKSVQAAGGLLRPRGVTAEEWRSRVPRALHHRKRKGPGIPLDIYAQDLADQGQIRDAYGDEALDFIIRQHDATKEPAPEADPKELRRQARQVVDQKAHEAVRELVSAARVQAELVCPPGVRISRNPPRRHGVLPRRRRPLKSNPAARRIMKAFHGDIRKRIRIEFPKLPDTGYQIGRLDAVIYTPPRWSRIGENPRIHHFDTPKPRLVGFNSRSPWMILGGKTRFTSRGFIG